MENWAGGLIKLSPLIHKPYRTCSLLFVVKLRFNKKYIFNKKDPDAGRDWEQEEKGMTEDEMAGWHHLKEMTLT